MVLFCRKKLGKKEIWGLQCVGFIAVLLTHVNSAKVQTRWYEGSPNKRRIKLQIKY